jgi:hypothetical protein
MKRGEGAPEGAQALSQALSGLLLSRTAPEHRSQLVSCVALLRSDSEVRDKGLSLPRGKRQASLAILGLKPSEKPKGETRHCAFPEYRDPSFGPLR